MKISPPTPAVRKQLEAVSGSYKTVRDWLETSPPRELVLSMLSLEHQRKGGPRGPAVQALIAREIRDHKDEIFTALKQR